jgi:hypothetical protein
MTMTTPAPAAAAATTMPPDYGPFRTREQAEAVFGGFREAARADGDGVAFWSACALTDTLDCLIAPDDMFSGPLGDYDRQVLDELAGRLDPLAVAVLCSLILRAAHHDPEW